MTMVSGDVSGETVRPKRLSKASPLQIDRGCTRRRLGRRSLNVDISLIFAIFRAPRPRLHSSTARTSKPKC